jgi:membrane-bound lytic murein transglycosylase D
MADKAMPSILTTKKTLTMPVNYLKTPRRIIFLVFLLALTSLSRLSAQSIPEVPQSVLFGGINVKFDRDARRIIETDIRNLMANKRYWDDKLDRAVLYFPILEGVLIEEEVPIDFKYLAVQESSLTPDAVSTSNAVGFWQFKQETALEMGLRVDNEIDERKNIASSTRAAARYLKRSNKQFNNWVSSLYSYYLGMGGISKIVPADWAYAREITLNSRTDVYVLRFFAHKIAIEAAMDQHRTANTIVLLEYRKGRGQSLGQIAEEMGVDPLDIRRYNRWLASDRVHTDRDYVVALPVASSSLNNVRQKIASSTSSPGPLYTQNDIGFPILKKVDVKMKGTNNPSFYEINGLPGIQARAGDKAADLARIAKMSTSTFLKYNDLSPREALIPGNVYYLSKKNKKAMVPYHTVRQGETIRNISQIYGIATRELLKYNRISSRNQRLQTGRVMWLMKKRPAKTPVEIMEIPTGQPTWDNQPEITSTTPDYSIPQDASERKKYTPKLVPPVEAPVEQPVDTRRAIVEEPQPTQPQTPLRSVNDTGSRVVIISQEGSSEPQPSTPVRTPEPQTTTPTRSPATASTTTRQPDFNTGPSRQASSGGSYHTVSSGQTYYSISRMYNLEINELLALNNLTLKDILEVGQKLLVNKSSASVATQNVATPNEAGSRYTYHRVSSGETLFSISKKYGVSMSEIQRANSMSDTNVKLGENLKIPQQ